MAELSGLELATLLPTDIAIIFVTGHVNEAYNAFERNAIDFILKPYGFERFLRAINKVKNTPQHINNKADRILN
jgi:two-component system LytT family response regulator